MKMKFSKEATIDVVSIISLVLLYIGVNYLKGINLFRAANHYYSSLLECQRHNHIEPCFC